MLKINKIEFQKSTYDDSLTHHIFSTANVYFSNANPIIGALLYWKENADVNLFTKENEYKFFYDMTETKYYASVKFPKECTLTKDERQELAYILLEQRGCIGTYSFQTDNNAANVFKIKQLYEQLLFPKEFNSTHFSHMFNVPSSTELEAFIDMHPYYNRDFVVTYCNWMQLVCQAHPSYFEHNINRVEMTQLCYQNPYLTEMFIIQYLDRIEWDTLQYNLPVLNRLSKSTKQWLVSKINKDRTIQHDIQWNERKFIESKELYYEDQVIYLPDDEEDHLVFGPFQYFSYDRGKYVWPGSEHLITTIPSFARKLFNIYGEKCKSHKEMDALYESFSAEQRYLFETTCELHWLNRYKNKVNWSKVSALNPNLTERFIEKHIKWIDVESLGQNTQISLSSKFIEKNLFQLSKPVATPLLLKHLTEELYTKYEHQIALNTVVLKEYEQILPTQQIELIERLRDI